MTNKAFIVGIDTKGLQYCQKDALSLEKALSIYAYEIERPIVHTKGGLQDQIASFFDSCNKADSVLLYFSGHAFLERGKLYFLLANDVSLKSNLLNLTEIIDEFSSVISDSKLVILDCCNAGGALVDWKPSMPDPYFLLTASSLLENAKELDQFKSSFLTYKICEFLNTHPKDYVTEDSEILLSNLFTWLKQEAINNNSLAQVQVPLPNLFGNSKFNFCFGKRMLPEVIKEKQTRDIRTAISSSMPLASLSAASSLSLSPKNLLDVFVEPILSLDSEYKTKSKKTMTLMEDESQSEEIDDRFLSPSVLVDSTENFLLIGRKESGKTSLLRYLQVRYMEREKDIKIPIYVNFMDLPQGKDKVERLIAQNLNAIDVSMESLKKELVEGNCVILVDNIIFDSKRSVDALEVFFTKYPKNKYVFTTDENMLNELRLKQLSLLGITRTSVFIHSFKRKQIKELIEKWFDDRMEIDETEDLLSQVVKSLNSLHFPSTPLMISLILLVFECQPNFDYILVNKSSLIEKLLEFLLQKMTPSAMGRGKIDYRKKEHILSHIAHSMEEIGQYSISFTDLSSVVNKYFLSRALVPPVDLRLFIQKNLIDCGVLVNIDGNVSFRFSCFAEYFIAKYIKENKKFYDYIMTDERFLGYVSELDYLTGLERTNRDLIEIVSANLEKIMKELKIEKK